MDETTNNVTWWNDTTANGSNNFTLSFPCYTEPVWEPYTFEKYLPKWHIKKGYKYQIKHMWD